MGGLDGKSGQCLGGGLQALKRERLRLAQIARRELAVLLAIGFPVPAPALMA